MGTIPGQQGRTTYELCLDVDDGDDFQYLCGIEVSDTEDLPDAFTYKRLPPQTYAIFSPEGHVSILRQTHDAVAQWLAT